MSDSSSNAQVVSQIEQQVGILRRGRGSSGPLEREQLVQYVLRLLNSSFTPVNSTSGHLDSIIYSIQSKCEHQTRAERFRVDQLLHKASLSRSKGKTGIQYILNSLSFPYSGTPQFPSVSSSPLVHPAVAGGVVSSNKEEPLGDHLLLPDAFALLLGYPGNFVQIHSSSSILPITASASNPYDTSSSVIVQPCSQNTAPIDTGMLNILSGIAYCGLLYQYIYEYCNLHRNNTRNSAFHAFISFVDQSLQNYSTKVVALQHRSMQTRSTLRSVYIWSLQHQPHLQEQYNVCQYTRGQSAVALLESLVSMDTDLHRDLLHHALRPQNSIFTEYLRDGRCRDVEEGFISHDEHGRWERTLLDTSKVPFFVSSTCVQTVFRIARILLYLRNQCDFPVSFILPTLSILPSSESMITISLHSEHPLDSDISCLLPIVCTNKVSSVAERLIGLCNRILHHVLTTRFALRDNFSLLHSVFLGSRSDVLHCLLQHTGSVLNNSVADTSELQLQQLLNVSLLSLPKNTLPAKHVDKQRVEQLRGGVQERVADVFSMHYSIEEPLQVQFGKPVLDAYKRIFTLLLRTTRAIQDVGHVFILHKQHRSSNMKVSLQHILLRAQTTMHRATLVLQHITAYIHQCLREYTAEMDIQLQRETNIEQLQTYILNMTQDQLSRLFLSSSTPEMQNSLTFIARIVDIVLQWRFVVHSFYNTSSGSQYDEEAVSTLNSRIQVLSQSLQKIVPAFLLALEQVQRQEEVVPAAPVGVLDILQPSRWSDPLDVPSCIHARIHETRKSKDPQQQQQHIAAIPDVQSLRQLLNFNGYYNKQI